MVPLVGKWHFYQNLDNLIGSRSKCTPSELFFIPLSLKEDKTPTHQGPWLPAGQFGAVGGPWLTAGQFGAVGVETAQMFGVFQLVFFELICK